MKKKQILPILLMGAIGITSVALFGQKAVKSLTAEEVVHKLVLNKDNAFTSEENTAHAFTRNTNEGNPINFSLFGGASLIPNENNFARACDTNGWFKNTTPLNGLYKIKISCTPGAVFRFDYGMEADALDFSTADYTGSVDYEIDLPSISGIKYMQFSPVSSSNNWIASMELFYTCSDDSAPRGVHFNQEQGSGGIDYTPVDNKVIVDMKFTTATKVALQLFDHDWSGGGYKDFYPTMSMTGVTVKPLIDGYFRYVIDLTSYEFQPSVVELIELRKEWTDGEGYIDVTKPNVAELKGKQLNAPEEGVGWTEFSFTSPDPVNGAVVLDVMFRQQGELSVQIGGTLGSDTDCYYGPFNISRTGVSHQGITLTRLGNGYYRYTFTYAELNRVKFVTSNEKLESVNKVALRSDWCSCKDAIIDLVSY